MLGEFLAIRMKQEACSKVNPRLVIAVVITKPIRTRPAMAICLTTSEPLMNLKGLSQLLDWRKFTLEEGKTRIYIYVDACNRILEMVVLL